MFCLLVEVHCHWCGRTFYVCHRCWRGQAYCDEVCRLLARRGAHREAQREYRQTEKGKGSHLQAERCRRRRRRILVGSGLDQKKEKTMDDQSSKALLSRVIEISMDTRSPVFHPETQRVRYARCHFCGCRGKVVDQFPRRE